VGDAQPSLVEYFCRVKWFVVERANPQRVSGEKGGEKPYVGRREQEKGRR
jgi:hypothetical protein